MAILGKEIQEQMLIEVYPEMQIKLLNAVILHRFLPTIAWSL